jgi:protein-L-isoaspartate(D-aspartate) O-methyltransferase
MDQATELAIIRRAYAKNILATVQLDDPRLEAAFAEVPREDFLGSGPWVIPRWVGGYGPTPSADPVYLYVDNIVQIVAEKRLNNGQPSGHAKWIASASIAPGDHVVHVGTGTGYYTAILAHMAGPAGKVTGIEFDPDLAGRAKANLAPFANVELIEGDGTAVPFEAADVIYVNAGVTRPADAWLDRLADGGRLVVPLTTNEGFGTIDFTNIVKRGAMFRFERQGADYLAQWITPINIFPCEGGRDDRSEAALVEAFAKGGWDRVTRLYRTGDVPEDRCWLRAEGWCLAFS